MRLMKHKFPKVSLRKLLAAGAGVVILSVVAIRPAHPQFGFDIAAILAGLQQINSTLGSAVAAPLRLINQVEQQERQFQQQVLYPVIAINSARQMANGFSNSFLSFRQLGTMNISSAQLPNPQQLERQMLSANPNNIASIAAAYQSVFSPLPAKTAVPQNVASQIDMGDAQAQDAIKKAIELDALASREMEVAQKLNDQIAASAPGTAPILDAEASAWVVQANAYTQMGMAELIRLNSAAMSNRSGELKRLNGTDAESQSTDDTDARSPLEQGGVHEFHLSVPGHVGRGRERHQRLDVVDRTDGCLCPDDHLSRARGLRSLRPRWRHSVACWRVPQVHCCGVRYRLLDEFLLGCVHGVQLSLPTPLTTALEQATLMGIGKHNYRSIQ